MQAGDCRALACLGDQDGRCRARVTGTEEEAEDGESGDDELPRELLRFVRRCAPCQPEPERPDRGHQQDQPDPRVQ